MFYFYKYFLKYINFFISVIAELVSVLDIGSVCAPNFGHFLHLCLSIADQMHFFIFFHDPAADFMATNLDDFVLSNSYLRTPKFLLKSDMQNANRTKRINS